MPQRPPARPPRALLAALLPALLAAGVACAPRPAPAQTVILVRHAEKAAPSGDVALSAVGEARAQALADALRDAGVTAVVTTELKRTQQTAQPLAAARGLTPRVVATRSGATAAHAEAVAEVVRGQKGGVVLVVGHSNTVPAIVGALGGPRLPQICDAEYANLFVVTLGDSARLIRSKYGAPDPAGGPECGTAMQMR
jgi:broad specificity phosphatase PhoE